MNSEIKNPLQVDFENLAKIEQTFNLINQNYKRNAPQVTSRKFFKENIKNVEIHSHKLLTLQEQSARTYFHTEFGLYIASLLDRAINCQMIRWQKLSLACEKRDESLVEESEQLLRELLRICESISKTMAPIKQRIESALAKSTDDAGVFHVNDAEVKNLDGRQRIET